MKALFYTREFPPYVYGGAGVHVEYLADELSKLMDLDVRCFGDQDSKNTSLSVKGFPFEDGVFEHTDDKLKSVFKTLTTGLGRGYDASSWVEKTAIEMADALIAVSKETKEDVIKHFNVDENKVKVIYNGINLQQYIQTSETETLDTYGVDKTKPYVLFVGRITRQKGIIHLVNAIKYIDPDTQIVLCAGAPDTKEIGEEMKAAVTEVQKTRDNVIWIDKMVTKEEIIQLYSHADVFCCPSIYEPFGIINIEAMACNTAVVASAVGGIKEVVLDGETGILVPLEQQTEAPFEPINPDKFSRDLANGVNTVIADKVLRTSMAKKGRQRVEDYFDWIAIAKQTEALYKTLL